jgi:hypothetical protein
MTPHVVNNNVIGYTTRTGSTLYKAASKGLFGDTKQDKYDLAPKGLLTFLNEFAAQAEECGWMTMFMINTNPGGTPAQNCNLLTQYSSLIT